MDPKKYHRDHFTTAFGHTLEAQIGGVDEPALGIKGRSAVSKRGEGFGARGGVWGNPYWWA